MTPIIRAIPPNPQPGTGYREEQAIFSKLKEEEAGRARHGRLDAIRAWGERIVRAVRPGGRPDTRIT